jgi:hypothetical protein
VAEHRFVTELAPGVHAIGHGKGGHGDPITRGGTDVRAVAESL